MSDTGAGLKPLERIKNVLAELWLANCCLAHDSLGFPVLLRFYDPSFGRSHSRASQTLASRKFNVFIDFFVGQIDFRPI
jgi:hypothetical protein